MYGTMESGSYPDDVSIRPPHMMDIESQKSFVKGGDDATLDLVESCRRGESSGFEAIFDRFFDRIYRTCFLIIRDHEEARDLAQETFVRFHRSLDTYRAETRLISWLLRIATNLSLNALRNKRKCLTVSVDGWNEDETPLKSERPGPDEMVLKRQEVRAVESFMMQLEPDFRATAVLRFYHELSYEEIATALEINVGTVRSRLSTIRWQARTTLRGR